MNLVKHVKVKAPALLVDLLAESTGLSKSGIKDCLIKGAVFLNRPGKKEQRIRRAKFSVRSKDRISIYYNESILKQIPPTPLCLYKGTEYSVWNKPSGLLSQGTQYGDHCSLLRIAEKTLSGEVKSIHLVHRLDRDACGIVLLAHNTVAAAAISDLFKRGKIEKRYCAVALGLVAQEGETFRIDTSLDNKNAITEISVLRHDTEKCQTILDINLLTGRYHQIRRHLSSIGHPLVGDRKYGNPQGEDLHLEAYMLSFYCPFSKSKHVFRLPEKRYS
ncbi:RluA family pseudouridine synthase [Desulfosediminicola flagellatus]|uniref:RluA family pseudouridine synthase n=1 Tax=Desulfosediminicola flagellatus TaxID=2569541 RepID=UPI00142EE033|nr:RluA family pseudouridine synthase [Desulfosediminicola flagellatus]